MTMLNSTVPAAQFFDLSHTQQLWNAIYHSGTSTPEEVGLRHLFSTVIDVMGNWKNVSDNRDTFFSYDQDRDRWDCLLCNMKASNWAGHMLSKHSDAVLNQHGIRFGLKEWLDLDHWFERGNEAGRLLGSVVQDYRPGIRGVIAANIRFYKGMTQMVRQIPFKQLKEIVLGDDNKCLGCGQQVRHLREHVIDAHLDDIGFELAEKPPLVPKPRLSEAQKRLIYKQTSTRATTGSYASIWNTTS